MRAYIRGLALSLTMTTAIAHASSAQVDQEPVRAVQAVIGKVGKLPCWCGGGFSTSVSAVVTGDLIRAVEYGGAVAAKKSINLYDGDFFTGQQNVRSARLLSGHVTSRTGTSATVEARIAIDYADGSIYPPTERTYWLKRDGGQWKIDDIGMNGIPVVKHHFLHPEED